MKREEEQLLIRSIAGGETDRFAELVERYGRPVFVLVQRIVGSPQDAEEVAQDTFLKAFRHLDRFDGRSAFSTWLFRIAFNTAISKARRRKREYTALDERALAAVPDAEADALFERYENPRLLTALQRALDALPPDESALVTLHYYHDCPLSSCAEVLSISEANAKVRLHRIRKKLCIQLKSQTDETPR